MHIYKNDMKHATSQHYIRQPIANKLLSSALILFYGVQNPVPN